MMCPDCHGQALFMSRTPNKVTATRCESCRGTGEKTVRPTVRRSAVSPSPKPLRVYIPDQVSRHNYFEQTDWKQPGVESGKRWRN